ncbi:MAG: hypothetical protein AABY22_25410 [Nanoarchaeota archaeon]
MDKSISLYSTAFNVIKCKFDYSDALTNFCNFAEEVVLSVNTSEDNTLEAIQQWKKDNKVEHLKILETNISYESPWWDGLLKNNSLQNCTYERCIQCDLDERIIFCHKDRWLYYFDRLEKSKFKAYLVPSVEVIGDMKSIRWDKKKHLLFKWHLHLKNGTYRSPVKEARLLNGCIDILKSDTCELTDKDGNLIESPFLLPDFLVKKPNLQEYLKFLDEQGIFCYHLGYLDASNRIFRNQSFWSRAWEVEAGRPIEIPMHESQLFYPTVEINLPDYK